MPSPNPGRPSLFTPHLGTLIAEGLAQGATLVEICASPEMPDRRQVQRWVAQNPDFAALIARARLESADAVDEEIMTIARASTPETASSDRVKIDALRWRAAHLNRARYGERQAVDLGAQTSLADLVMASIKITRAEADRLMAPTIEGEASPAESAPPDAECGNRWGNGISARS